MTILFLPFQLLWLLFLTTLVRTSSSVLMKSNNSEHSCLFKGMTNISLLNMSSTVISFVHTPQT